jgi:hypothetical protein
MTARLHLAPVPALRVLRKTIAISHLLVVRNELARGLSARLAARRDAAAAVLVSAMALFRFASALSLFLFATRCCSRSG